ncbi:LysR family transcriptional regulator [Jannaschia donghaensis]|uniref:Galactose-binding protein regulator n=1 Tax=Jannaschia donghaensis TaxID=420998 RepID=A0A0M6YEF2_9RHOB|nr:LysR family transcriptional regulator [Jannaschia donghaensis]CTQ48314.1 Galactose-binding protein regulator [Jannaschia donghaensis]
MNLRALSVFVGIIEEETLTRAAARMNLSQSAASRLLSLLEVDLAAELFARDGRRMVPTAAAEALYPEALRILAQVDALPDVAATERAGAPLRVICHPRLAGGLVVPAFATLARRQPDLRVRFETAPRRELARRVLAGRYDLAVAALPLSLGAVEAVTLGTVRLGILLARDHPLADRPSLDLSDLSDVPYIALDETTAVRRLLDATLPGQRGPLQPRHEVSTGTNAYRLVAAGLGFTFADPVALDPELRDRVRLIPWRRSQSIAFGYFRFDGARMASVDAMVRAMEDVVRPLLQAP